MIGCLSITAALFSIGNGDRTVTVLAFPIPIVMLISMAHFLLTILQGRVYLHLMHIIRLVDQDEHKHLTLLDESPVFGIYTCHDDTSLGDFLSGFTIWVQLFLLPLITIGVPTVLASLFVIMGIAESRLQYHNFLFAAIYSPIPILIGFRTACQFRGLCKRISTNDPAKQVHPPN
ncbi:MAG: hypothetical protein ED559_09045 [Phycisphaera sp.]|nr:MAG: hypothetical protein ED559_09045 [Phycisphaera sp.]